MNRTANRPPLPAFFLKVGERHMPLDAGTELAAGDLPQVVDRGLVGRVQANPKYPDVLGLQNLTAKAWSVHSPDGDLRSVEPQKTVKLCDGTVIDFGGVEGTVLPPYTLVGLEPIGQEEMLRLAATLVAVHKRRLLPKEQFEKLHAEFYARDDLGDLWTVGLNSQQWTRAKNGRWTLGQPPGRLYILAKTLDAIEAAAAKV